MRSTWSKLVHEMPTRFFRLNGCVMISRACTHASNMRVHRLDKVPQWGDEMDTVLAAFLPQQQAPSLDQEFYLGKQGAITYDPKQLRPVM